MKKIIFIFVLLITLLFVNSASAETFNVKENKVYLGGETVGIKLNTGVTVSKTFPIINGTSLLKPWENADLRENDIILSYAGVQIKNSDDLLNAIKINKNKEVRLEIQRQNNKIQTTIKPVLKDDSYTLGIYVKDNVLGVGTLTYIIPNSKIFGALGHHIEAGNLYGGTLYEATVTGIKKGSVGEAGSKKATINTKTIGTIEKNTITGIHGIYEEERSERNLISIARKEDVHKGKAQIVTCIDKKYIDYYDIEITEVVKQNKKDVKGIKFKVVDPVLLSATNGIIQGMSGSPIVQDGKLVGAVTHVLVNNPHEGYGIFIEFMFMDMGVEIT